MRFVLDLVEIDAAEVDVPGIIVESLRLIYGQMQQVPMVDLAFSLKFVRILDSEKKARRYLSRLQETIEVSNPVLLKQPYNQDALLEILVSFKKLGYGNIMFREKIASLLQTMIEKETWIPLHDSSQVANLISCLRDIHVAKF